MHLFCIFALIFILTLLKMSVFIIKKDDFPEKKHEPQRRPFARRPIKNRGVLPKYKPQGRPFGRWPIKIRGVLLTKTQAPAICLVAYKKSL